MADVDSHLTDTSVSGEEDHSTLLTAHTRIFTRLILILMCSRCVVLRAPADGGQSYLATLITLQICTKLTFFVQFANFCIRLNKGREQ